MQERVKSPKFDVIGTRPVRPDGADKVLGRANFGADLRLPGMLEGRVEWMVVRHVGFVQREPARRAFPTAVNFHLLGDHCAHNKFPWGVEIRNLV